MPKIIQCIESEEIRGDGSKEYPTRRVMAYFTLDGQLLAEKDRFWFVPYEREIHRLEKELALALAKIPKVS